MRNPNRLSAREWGVLMQRYMLREKQTLRAIGLEQGVGPERIRQIEASALSRLRHAETLYPVLSTGIFDEFPRLAAKVFGETEANIPARLALARS